MNAIIYKNGDLYVDFCSNSATLNRSNPTMNYKLIPMSEAGDTTLTKAVPEALTESSSTAGFRSERGSCFLPPAFLCVLTPITILVNVSDCR